MNPVSRSSYWRHSEWRVWVSVAVMSIQKWRDQGSSNGRELLCLVPTKSNVTGFPEPCLTFYEWELMENYIICFPKRIHYCNKGSVCFPQFFWQGRACKSPLKLSCRDAVIYIHTHRHRHTNTFKQATPKAFKYLFIGNSVPITMSRNVFVYSSLLEVILGLCCSVQLQ